MVSGVRLAAVMAARGCTAFLSAGGGGRILDHTRWLWTSVHILKCGTGTKLRGIEIPSSCRVDGLDMSSRGRECLAGSFRFAVVGIVPVGQQCLH